MGEPSGLTALLGQRSWFGLPLQSVRLTLGPGLTALGQRE
ncbi:hypothetical protein GFS31_00590 [Leptolyngbya sp. BL0902]|nr:hypothetical protein GFS31_00590 [Leptolyngbya sp. BL0902]